MLIDVHTHLDDKAFSKDLNEVIQRAKVMNVSLIINNGTNPESNRKTVELSKRFDIIKPALGIYPIDAIEMPDEDIDKEIEFIQKSKPIAIGEIGLDYYQPKNGTKKQKSVFEKMISVAERLKIPAVIHSRKAEGNVINILESSRLRRIVLHCFQGSKNLVKMAENNGWFFSIPPMIVYSKQQQMIAEQCSINQILTESDAPYLGPVRGQRNEPANILKTIEKISEIRNLNKNDVIDAINDNFKKLFLE